MAYPIDVQVDYGDGTRSRGYAVLGIVFFLKGLLLIPHMIVLWIFGFITSVAMWIGYWAILFTGSQPEGISRLVAGIIRWYTRTSAWLYATTDAYPEFGFDDGAGSQTTVDVDGGSRNRLLGASGIVFIKPLLLLPHYIVLGVLGFVAGIGAWFGYWIILFTGRLPEGLHTFLTGLMRWTARTYGWMGSITDEYPPFSFD